MSLVIQYGEMILMQKRFLDGMKMRKEKALDALKKYKCSYQESNGMYDIEEYALEYFDSDEDGEFVAGSDYDIAETE